MNRISTNGLRPSTFPALLLGALLFACPARGQAAPETDPWQAGEKTPQKHLSSETWVQPKAFRSVQLQHSRLHPLLGKAPKESAQTLISSGALITRYPDGLIRALKKIQAENLPMAHASAATAHMFLANPFNGKFFSKLLSTHPPIEDRIAALEKMAGPAL